MWDREGKKTASVKRKRGLESREKETTVWLDMRTFPSFHFSTSAMNVFMNVFMNKAGYTAIGAPKHLYKGRRNGRTDGRRGPLIEVLRST